jgi:hypothetical protein
MVKDVCLHGLSYMLIHIYNVQFLEPYGNHRLHGSFVSGQQLVLQFTPIVVQNFVFINP